MAIERQIERVVDAVAQTDSGGVALLPRLATGRSAVLARNPAPRVGTVPMCRDHVRKAIKKTDLRQMT